MPWYLMIIILSNRAINIKWWNGLLCTLLYVCVQCNVMIIDIQTGSLPDLLASSRVLYSIDIIWLEWDRYKILGTSIIDITKSLLWTLDITGTIWELQVKLTIINKHPSVNKHPHLIRHYILFLLYILLL